MKNVGYVNFNFDKAGGRNVISNLLYNHSRPKINTVLENSTRKRKTCIRDVATPMGIIYRELVQTEFLQSREGEVDRKSVV